MSKYVFSMGFWFSALLGLAACGAAWAKPADLPANNDIQCPECGDKTSTSGSIMIGLDLFSGGVTVDVNSAPQVPAALDTLMPAIVPAALDHLLKIVNEAIKPLYEPNGSADAEAMRELQGRRLFVIAELLRAQGQYQQARLLYQQVHMLTPTSRQGRLAIERLSQIEERLRDAAEESGQEDNPEEAFRQIQETTIPLGLVETWY